MKAPLKVTLVASLVVTAICAVFSLTQYQQTKNFILAKKQQSVDDISQGFSNKTSDWLNGKLGLISLTSEIMDANFSAEFVKKTLQTPILDKEFELIFGGLDTDGAWITNSSTWNPLIKDVRVRPWYPLGKNASTATLTAPFADAAGGGLIISAVAKITENGEFKGVFGGDLSLTAISKSLSDIKFNDTGYAFLVNDSGMIISHPYKGLFGKPISDLFDGKAPTFTNTLSGVTIGGKKFYSSFTTIEGVPGAKWFVGAVIDEDLAMQEAVKQSWTALALSITSVLVCSFIIYLVVVRLLKPTKE